MLSKVAYNSKRFLSIFLSVVFLLCSFSFSASALTDAQKQEYESQIKDIEKEIAENQEKIDDLEEEASKYDDDISILQDKIDVLQDQIDLFNQEIALIDKDINRIDNQIKSVEKEIDGLNNQIKLLDEQIIGLEQDKADIYVLLGERLRASYMSGVNSPIEFILTSDDFDFLVYLERIQLLQSIAENDNKIIKELEEKIEDINVKVSEIDDAKKRLNTKIAELDEAKIEYEEKKQIQVDARSIIEDKEAIIQADLDKIMSIVNALDRQSDAYQAAIDQREQAILELENKLSSGNTHYGSGVVDGDMVWPLPYEDTYISSSYKIRWGKQHNGIDTCRWSGTHGADVIAVKDGVIDVASWGYGGGYGNYVVVDHGEGVLTYYAHLSNITVRVGQRVSQGDVIGQAGNTGYSFGAHLHFGIMINGSWKNPVNYLTCYTPGGKRIEAVD